MAQTVKNLPAMQETWVPSLGREGPLEKGMATHPSILAWRIPWTEEPGGLQSTGSQRVTTEQLTHTQGKNPRQRPIAFRLFREPEETFDGSDGSRAKKGPDPDPGPHPDPRPRWGVRRSPGGTLSPPPHLRAQSSPLSGKSHFSMEPNGSREPV